MGRSMEAERPVRSLLTASLAPRDERTNQARSYLRAFACSLLLLRCSSPGLLSWPTPSPPSDVA